MEGAGEAANPLLEFKCANLMSFIDRAQKVIVVLLFSRSGNGHFMTITIIYHITDV